MVTHSCCAKREKRKENTKKMSEYEKQRFHSYYDTPEFQKKLIGTRGLREMSLFDMAFEIAGILIFPIVKLFLDIAEFSTLFLLYPFVAIGIILLIIAGILFIAVFHLPAVGIICIAAPFVSDIIVCFVRSVKEHLKKYFYKRTGTDCEISKRLYDRTDEHLELEYNYYVLRSHLLSLLGRYYPEDKEKMDICRGACMYHHLALHDVDIPRWAPHYTGFTDEFSIIPKYVTATTPEELKAEYKTLIKKYHPDNCLDDENAHANFAEMKEEYECYKNFFESDIYNSAFGEKTSIFWLGANPHDASSDERYVHRTFSQMQQELAAANERFHLNVFDAFDRHSRYYNEEIYDIVNLYHVDFTHFYDRAEYI